MCVSIASANKKWVHAHTFFLLGLNHVPFPKHTTAKSPTYPPYMLPPPLPPP